MKVLFIVPYPIEAASTRYRIEQYLPYLRANGIEPTVSRFIHSSNFFSILYKPGRTLQKGSYFVYRTLARFLDLLRVQRFDVVCIQREALPVGPAIFEQLVAALGCPIVFDFDDAIYLHHASAANRWVSWLKQPSKTAKIIQKSAHVIVGNNELRKYALQHNSAVSVIPSSINMDQYVIRPDERDTAGANSDKQGADDNEKIIIGWVGSNTTIQFVRTIVPVLQKLAQRFPIEFQMVGGDIEVPNVATTSRAWTLANEISDLHGFDIGVMPLPNNEWTRGKGGFKAIQYMGVGVPVVASPVGINTEIIAHNESGLLASGEAEWTDALTVLIENAALRKKLGMAGRKVVEERYSVQANAPKLRTIFESIIEGKA